MSYMNIREYIGASGNHYLIEVKLDNLIITKLRGDRSEVFCAVITKQVYAFDFIEWFDNKYPNYGESEE